MNRTELIENIEKTLNKIRPYIQRDGGDVEFIDVDEHGVVSVRMLGACATCLSLDTTLSDGIEAILIDEVEGVHSVKLYEETSF